MQKALMMLSIVYQELHKTVVYQNVLTICALTVLWLKQDGVATYFGRLKDEDQSSLG
jgi:hypothetical protein